MDPSIYKDIEILKVQVEGLKQIINTLVGETPGINDLVHINYDFTQELTKLRKLGELI